MTTETTTYEASAYYDTARFTFRSLIPLLVGGGRIGEEEPPTADTAWWNTRLIQNVGDTEITWSALVNAYGHAVLTRSVSFLTPAQQMVNHTAQIHEVTLSDVTREAFSSLICEAIIGHPFVPLMSRREAREVWEVAQSDAAYIYKTGMHHILTKGGGGAGWNEGEIGEMWDEIHAAAQTFVGHDLGDHKSVLRKAGVVTFSRDVYNDGFHEKAYELMREAGLGVKP